MFCKNIAGYGQHRMKTNEPETIKITINDPRYPNRVKTIMGNKAPLNLYMMGNIDILNFPGLGFCGSRKSSVKGIETTQDCAEQAAQRSISVISGNAAGVDFEAHYNCLKVGGKTILVLPEGIEHFRIKKALEPVWNWDNILIISQFEPNEPWKAFRAMIRNQLIIALSRVMIVIEAGEKGGTFNAGKETMKFGLPLFVAQYHDMSIDARGNKILLDLGAFSLAKSRHTNKANLENVFNMMEEDPGLNKILNQASLL